jgi:hypothetical protein
MKINKLIIKNGIFEPTTIIFEKHTLITSDKNSRGKTSLIRYILFSLGYKIPSTKRLRMEENGTTVYLSISYSNLIIKRDKDKMSLEFEDGTTLDFDLTLDKDRQTVHSIIFETENISLLNNLLMIYYIDQDKGWTLLNRGKCIGNNRFDINDFIASLNGIDSMNINNEIDSIEKEIKKYSSLKKIIMLKDDF